MKKRVVGIFFALVLCLAMVPISAFAEQKTTIRTVDQLLQFAKAVDNGEYDDKTDAVVSLEADLDLKDVKTWTPIGSRFADDGTLLHYFSGKFYGNEHGRRLAAPTTTLTFRIFSAENFTATDIRFLIWTFPMPMA